MCCALHYTRRISVGVTFFVAVADVVSVESPLADLVLIVCPRDIFWTLANTLKEESEPAALKKVTATWDPT